MRGRGEPDLKVLARTHTAIKAKSCGMKRWLWVRARTWDVCQHAYATGNVTAFIYIIEVVQREKLFPLGLDSNSFQKAGKTCLLELIFGTLLCSSGGSSAVVQVALRPSRGARHSTA